MKKGERKPLSTIGYRQKSQLYGILTTAEVVNGWHVHYNTVIQAIKSGNIVARKAGRVWLISYRSVVSWWGKAQEARVYQDEE